jgi:hypothetical protein
MAPLSKAASHQRARIAALSRDREPDDPEILDARQKLRAEKLAAHVKAVVDQAPALTDAQLHRIAGLLHARVIE